jgi:hypothetical protein
VWVLKDDEKIIQDKEAQLVILRALDTMLCDCECESKYIKRLITTLEDELKRLKND